MITCAPALQRLFGVLDYLVDERVGVVRHLTELEREPGAPEFFHFFAKTCDTRAFNQQRNHGNAGGASTERGLAMAKAIGEAVERYCSAFYERDDLTFTSFAEASVPCTDPSRFALYLDRQYRQPYFPYVPFGRNTPVYWTHACDAVTGDKVYVPAAMVFMPYYFHDQRGEQPITQRISTGLACHCSWPEAAISAICEVIERDAFTITWQSMLGPPHILNDTLSDENTDLIKRIEHTGARVTLLNITLEHGVPTVLAVAHQRGLSAPALIFAASASLDPEMAARKSLEELAHTWRLAHQLKTRFPPLVPGPYFEKVKNQDDHVHLYCDHANTSLAEFLFNSSRRINFQQIAKISTGDAEQDLQNIVERLFLTGHKVLLADLTTTDIRDLGLWVVRAIIPGFHPLFIGHHLRAQGGSRLWEVPQRLGYRGIFRETGDNPAPHPYP
ncbi:MAG: hypothetical protein GDA67_12260 [Nitrospira sp. CR1.3]|nr:hypothetical protein [Nitrospira sp. CR1.3]